MAHTQSRFGVERRRNAVVTQDPPALSQKPATVAIREMLDEVLAEDQRDILERQTLRDVEHAIDARVIDRVDVDPARQNLRAAAEMELDH